MSAPRNFISVHDPETQSLRIKPVAIDAPWDWLAAGWQDFRAAPAFSMAFGFLFAAIAYVFAFLLTRWHALPLILPLSGGFLLVGPLFGVGLYDISRRRERGEKPSLASLVSAVKGSAAKLGLVGVLLLLIFIFWMQCAFLLFMLFFGNADIPPADHFLPTLILEPHGVFLLVTGTVVGALFAIAVYGVSAISVPILFDRDVDAVSAVRTSLEAVNSNRPAMMLWAVLIAALTGLGFVTLFAGLAIIYPLIGYATWHAYRDVTQA